MKRTSSAIIFFRWIIIVGLLCGIGYLTKRYVGHALAGIPKELAASLIAAFAGLITTLVAASIALAVTLVTKHLESTKAIEARLREKKAEAYEPFLRNLFSAFWAIKDKTNIREISPEVHMIKTFQDFSPSLILWGSEGMIKTFTLLKEQSAVPENGFAVMEGMMREIRKDLGHLDTSLDDGDILRVFINDDEPGQVRQFVLTGKTNMLGDNRKST